METVTIWDKIKDTGLLVFDNILFAVVVFAIANILLNIVSAFTGKKIEGSHEDFDDKNSTTKYTLFRSLVRYLLYGFAIILCISHIGVQDEISSAFVTAGIGGLILSLGAQSIVKDIISGITIAFEKPYLVGDWVQIGEYEGEVVAVSLRATYIQQFGSKAVIPNGQVTNVVNFSASKGYLDFSVPVSNSVSYEKVYELIEGVIAKHYAENVNRYIEIPKVVGITAQDRFVYSVSIMGKVVSCEQWKIEKEIRAEIKKIFDTNEVSY